MGWDLTSIDPEGLVHYKHAHTSVCKVSALALVIGPRRVGSPPQQKTKHHSCHQPVRGSFLEASNAVLQAHSPEQSMHAIAMTASVEVGIDHALIEVRGSPEWDSLPLNGIL